MLSDGIIYLNNRYRVYPRGCSARLSIHRKDKKMTDYRLIQEQADEIIAAEPFYVASLANLSALLFESMERLNWAGFYLMDKGSLLVGPFQGRNYICKRAKERS